MLLPVRVCGSSAVLASGLTQAATDDANHTAERRKNTWCMTDDRETKMSSGAGGRERYQQIVQHDSMSAPKPCGRARCTALDGGECGAGTAGKKSRTGPIASSPPLHTSLPARPKLPVPIALLVLLGELSEASSERSEKRRGGGVGG